MTRDEYVGALQDMLSGDPARIRRANTKLFTATVKGIDPAKLTADAQRLTQREADLVLAEAG